MNGPVRRTRTRTGVYSEHATAEKGNARSPVRPAELLMLKASQYGCFLFLLMLASIKGERIDCVVMNTVLLLRNDYALKQLTTPEL